MLFAGQDVRITREWAMPSRWTFQIPTIKGFIRRWLPSHADAVVVDPFCGTSTFATYRNDLSDGGKTANEYLDELARMGVEADAVLLDPPYSPRQIAECYKGIGREVTGTDTQNAKMYSDAITRMDRILKVGGVALRFGWNSNGFGKTRGYEMREILIVAHGGAHNDTICTAEIKAR